MRISHATPRAIINWFEKIDIEHEILCCLVTADPTHREVHKEIIMNYLDADVAMGPKVAFIVFDGSLPRRPVAFADEKGSTLLMPGEVFEIEERTEYDNYLSSPLRDYFRDLPDDQIHKAIRDYGAALENGLESVQKAARKSGFISKLVEDSTEIMSYWIDLLEISREKLPVLCVFVKGSPPIAISLGEKLELSTLLRLLGKLADICSRPDDDIMGSREWDWDAAKRLERAQNYKFEFDKLFPQLINHFEAMCNRYKATKEERDRIVLFLNTGDFTGQCLEKLLLSFHFSNRTDFSNHQAIRGVRKSTAKMFQLEEGYENNLPNKAERLSISEALERLRIRQKKTADLVLQLRASGLDAKPIKGENFGKSFDGWVARATQLLTLGEKTHQVLSWIKEQIISTKILS
ncbi:hypothetical protein ABH944_008423 [Caballeronia udeis]|uniref:Uncharacterized protein n=1 Tax=Caballeronia udeis TaxID=1232866 RepID=A0ABW8MXA2_9BURK